MVQARPFQWTMNAVNVAVEVPHRPLQADPTAQMSDGETAATDVSLPLT